MKSFFIFVCLALFSLSSFAEERFYHHGDGCLFLKLKKAGTEYKGCYRKNGIDDPEQIKKLDTFLDVPPSLNEHFSLRTLSLLDFLQDKYKSNKPILITSRYRGPDYNESLRKKGMLAGKTSYHMDAMAVDAIFPGVRSIDVWKYVQTLNYGGVGYYEDLTVHIDSGKPRFWDRETAIDKKNEPQHNENIYMSVEKDIYHPGEIIQMFFSGVSDYPFGVIQAMQVSSEGIDIDIHPTFQSVDHSACLIIKKRDEARKIAWQIPKDFGHKNKKLHFHVTFCESKKYTNEKFTHKMPLEIDSREFEIR